MVSLASGYTITKIKIKCFVLYPAFNLWGQRPAESTRSLRRPGGYKCQGETPSLEKEDSDNDNDTDITTLLTQTMTVTEQLFLICITFTLFFLIVIVNFYHILLYIVIYFWLVNCSPG